MFSWPSNLSLPVSPIICSQVNKLQEQLRSAQAELSTAAAQAAAAQADAAAMQQQLQEAAQQLADARQQLADAAESRDAMQQQLSSLQAALQDAASEKDAAFTRLGESAGGLTWVGAAVVLLLHSPPVDKACRRVKGVVLPVANCSLQQTPPPACHAAVLCCAVLCCALCR